MPKAYPREFRRKVLDLLAAGKSVASIVSDRGGFRPDGLQLATSERIDRPTLPPEQLGGDRIGPR